MIKLILLIGSLFVSLFVIAIFFIILGLIINFIAFLVGLLGSGKD